MHHGDVLKMMHAAMHGKNIHERFVVSISCIKECMVDSGNIHEESIKLITKFNTEQL